MSPDVPSQVAGVPPAVERVRTAGILRITLAIGWVLMGPRIVAVADEVGATLVRAITNDFTELPLITLEFSSPSNLACFSLEEKLPPLLSATQVSDGGVFAPADNMVRWGPFIDASSVTVSYRVGGPPGAHLVSGRAWVDGQSMLPVPDAVVSVEVPTSSLPSPPVQVAMPRFTPASGSVVPADVILVCDTPGATIRYTLDGAVPDLGSAVYSTAVPVRGATVLRARGFKEGWTPSAASVAYYAAAPFSPELRWSRSVDVEQPQTPGVTLEFESRSDAVCLAVEEVLPLGVMPLGVSSEGVFDPEDRILRWGPFLGTNRLALSYYAVGVPGIYPLQARSSVNGEEYGETFGTNLTIEAGSGAFPLILVNGRYAREHWLDISRPAEATMLMPPVAESRLILYSLDGNEPYLDYVVPVAISESCVIRAAVYDGDYQLVSMADPVTVHRVPLHPLTTYVAGGGAVLAAPDPGPYAHQTVVTLTATSQPAWTFMRWEGDVTGTNAANSVLMDGPKRVTAVFGTPVGTAAIPSSGGYVVRSPAEDLNPFGGTVRLSAVPQGNYYFGQWQNAAAGVTNTPVEFVVTNASPSVAARFYPLSGNHRSLAVIVDGEGRVSRTPYQNYYVEGTAVELTAEAEPGIPFLGWSGDASGTNASLSVTLDTSKVITAHFGSGQPSFNQPPSVAIELPAEGAQFIAPANVSIDAVATDPEGSRVQVAFRAGALLLAVRTEAPYSYTWIDAPVGTHNLTVVATDDRGASATSLPVTIRVALPPPGPPVFSLSSPQYSVAENGGSVTVTVLKSLNSLAGAVNYTTANGSATALSGTWGDYHALSGSLEFANEETSRTVTIPIVDDYSYEGDQQFSFLLSVAGGDASLGFPSTATVTIREDDVPTGLGSYLGSVFPGAVPAHEGRLRVSLEPEGVGGGWRLGWERGWRGSGETVVGLATGNYEVEFKPVGGYAVPGRETNAVVTGGLRWVTNEYSVSGEARYGALRVRIEPGDIGGQWQLEGQGEWQEGGAVMEGVAEGQQVVRFRGLAGWMTPSARVVGVGGGQENEVVG
ncbi:MAG: chitobiase/beta-hexosaminidase C-terminal domain-containing protein, partial [Verrucomicrobia bacterium]|nr:chitobiase/beta-hexosaminidase C-terminal domain-containing protein [Verrucomicrobiota bacterium]